MGPQPAALGRATTSGPARAAHCGRDGCIEQFVSGPPSRATTRVGRAPPLDAPAIVAASEAGDAGRRPASAR
jgi:predicted NBD/HSP70 family sugar kinase